MTRRLKMYWSKSPKKWWNLGNLEQTLLRSAAVLNPYRNISSNIIFLIIQPTAITKQPNTQQNVQIFLFLINQIIFNHVFYFSIFIYQDIFNFPFFFHHIKSISILLFLIKSFSNILFLIISFSIFLFLIKSFSILLFLIKSFSTLLFLIKSFSTLLFLIKQLSFIKSFLILKNAKIYLINFFNY